MSNIKPSKRLSVVAFLFLAFSGVLIARLSYWQIIKAQDLSMAAAMQRQSVKELEPIRGKILASDGFPLAINEEGFTIYANPQKLTLEANALADMLTPILAPGLGDVKVATDATEEEKTELEDRLQEETYDYLYTQLKNKDLVWSLLKRKATNAQKTAIETLHIEAIGFSPEPIRAYPEASMAAQVLGFIGQDDYGKNVGYFGLEGYYDIELSGRIGVVKQEKDAINRPIPIGKFWDQEKRDGHNLVLYLDRSLQFLVEQELEKALIKFGAKSVSVVIMDPKTGGILSMATWPAFEPQAYQKYDQDRFINQLVSRTYEPGSTFKVLTMAAAIEEDLIEPTTVCDMCDGPYKIDQYFIRTWNNRYYPNSNMTEVLAHSDNTGMVFVAKKLGLEPFLKYIQNFGIGSPTGIDLQGEAVVPLRDHWSEVDVLTASFGQGLVVNGLQMVAAVGAIANNGTLMQPRMVAKIIDKSQEIALKPKVIRQVVSEETAKTVTDMMVAAVEFGDAKWAKPKGYKIAGKTGTAQVAVQGTYDEEKTIASFVGFAPADDPRFVMLTIVEEPTSSPWGSETAAPLFFDIAKKMFVYMGINPSE